VRGGSFCVFEKHVERGPVVEVAVGDYGCDFARVVDVG
jgi:hypothetical protein